MAILETNDREKSIEDRGCVQGFAMGALALMVAFVIGFFCGQVWGTRDEQKKAGAAGVGRWVADPDSGMVEFVYEAKKP